MQAKSNCGSSCNDLQPIFKQYNKVNKRMRETERRREPFSTESKVHKDNERDPGPPKELLGITVTRNHCGPHQGGWHTYSGMNSEAATGVSPLGPNQAERTWNSWSAPVKGVGGEPDMPWSLKPYALTGQAGMMTYPKRHPPCQRGPIKATPPPSLTGLAAR